MKAILEFDLGDPDDRVAHMRCVRAADLVSAVQEILTNLRGITKYGEGAGAQIAGKFREDIYRTLVEYNIDIEELL